MNQSKNKVIKNINYYYAIAQKDGFGSALYCVIYELINKIAPFSIYRVTLMRPQDIDPLLFNVPEPFVCRVLRPDESLHFASDPENDMSLNFVTDAIERGEECFGIFDNEKLASYAWYSDKPSHTRRELFFFFNEKYKYRHKAFTYADYRGRRLNVYNKALASSYYSKQGYFGLLSIVEAHNLNSLRSNRRIGSIVVGDIAVIMICNKYRVYANTGSRKIGCKIKPLKQH